MKQVILGQNPRSWRVDDDTRAARNLTENVLRHYYAKQLPHAVWNMQLACKPSQQYICAKLDEGVRIAYWVCLSTVRGANKGEQDSSGSQTESQRYRFQRRAGRR